MVSWTVAAACILFRIMQDLALHAPEVPPPPPRRRGGPPLPPRGGFGARRHMPRRIALAGYQRGWMGLSDRYCDGVAGDAGNPSAGTGLDT